MPTFFPFFGTDISRLDVASARKLVLWLKTNQAQGVQEYCSEPNIKLYGNKTFFYENLSFFIPKAKKFGFGSY